MGRAAELPRSPAPGYYCPCSCAGSAPVCAGRAPDVFVDVLHPPPAPRPRPLTPDERAIVAHVDAHNAEALALLERAVNINSGTQNHAGVREVGKVFAAELEALGFTTRWVDGAPFKRAGHLVAERARPGRRVLLIGHLDTVFEADSPFQKFERLERRSGPRAGHHRHEGRRRHHRPGAEGAAGGRRARPHERDRLHDRRRRIVRRPAGRGARGARRRGERRRRRHRLRGRRRRSEDRGHRPSRDHGVDAHGHRQAGPLVADLPPRHRLRRDLRGRADPRTSSARRWPGSRT